MAAHLYWRVFWHSSYGGAYMHVDDLDFQDAHGVSLVGGGEAIASSQWAPGTYSAARAFDKDPGSSWYSDNQRPSWLGYHFPAPVDVKIMTAGRSLEMLFFAVQSSDDGIAWTTEWLGTRIDPWGATDLVFPLRSKTRPARHWLMQVTDNLRNYPVTVGLEEMAFHDGNDSRLDALSYRGSINNGSPDWSTAFNQGPGGVFTSNTGNDGQFVQADFGTPVDVRALSFQSLAAPNHDLAPTHGRMWASPDGASWYHVWDFAPPMIGGLYRDPTPPERPPPRRRLLFLP
jgi:hypothetical protein